jgi:hypothetical protein
MLVTLGTNQAVSAGGSVTFPYACTSVQKIYVKIDDATGSTAYSHTVTIQLGSRTIANGVTGWGLFGMGRLQATQSKAVTTEIYYVIDLGSHQLLDNENLYVTITGQAALDAVDVSAEVDSAQGEFPVRYTEYSDNVFTAENVLKAISYNSSLNDVDEDNYNIEIRNAVNSSSPNLISASNQYSCSAYGSEAGKTAFGLLCNQVLPLTTTFNYPSAASTNTILVASQMGTSKRAVRQGVRQRAIARSQVGK